METHARRIQRTRARAKAVKATAVAGKRPLKRVHPYGRGGSAKVIKDEGDRDGRSLDIGGRGRRQLRPGSRDQSDDDGGRGTSRKKRDFLSNDSFVDGRDERDGTTRVWEAANLLANQNQNDATTGDEERRTGLSGNELSLSHTSPYHSSPCVHN